MSLEEAQEVDRRALGQHVGEEKAKTLGAEVYAVRRTVRKAEPLVHLWSRTKNMERPLDFGAACRKALL